MKPLCICKEGSLLFLKKIQPVIHKRIALSLNSKVGILTTISTLSTIFRKISTIKTADICFNIEKY